MKRRHLALALTPLLLVACGFHLKGTAGGDNRLRELQLDWPNGVDGELDSALKAALQQQNITLRAGAPLRVQLDPTDRQRVRTAIGGTGDTQEIELIDSIHARLEHNGTALGEQTFSSRSNVRYRSDTYRGSSQEEIEAHQQLARDNADKLIRYMNARIR